MRKRGNTPGARSAGKGVSKFCSGYSDNIYATHDVEEHEGVEDDEIHDQLFDKADAKVAPLPQPPSRQEALEHSCTHVPFRSWCAHCVRGKAKGGKHMMSGASAEADTPVVAFDYAFMGERPIDDPDKETEPHIKILVARDSRSRTNGAIPYLRKARMRTSTR